MFDLEALRRDLAADGLNLCDIFAVADLADSMPDLQLPASISHLMLIGSTGPDLWDAMPPVYFSKPEPVDEYSIDCVERTLGNLLAGGGWQILFPNLHPDDGESRVPRALLPEPLPVPLQKLGALAGWHHPSPLGIGINSTHGLWFAYRAAVAITVDVASADRFTDADQSSGADQIEFTSDSPCLSCKTTPCLTRCPADALTLAQNPDLDACVGYRAGEGSDCASTCLARLACPLGTEFRYTSEQTAYFYNRSLASAVHWIKKFD